MRSRKQRHNMRKRKNSEHKLIHPPSAPSSTALQNNEMIFLSILIPIFLIFNCASAPGTAETDYFLVQTIVVSRHSIRIPYGPPLAANASFFDDDSWSMWTSEAPPTPEEWGMTKEEVYAEPMLTPRGKEVARLTGVWFYEAMSGVVIPCDQITIFSDEASRDLQTAKFWIDGFGCPNNTIIEITDKNLPEMIPIVTAFSSIDGCNGTTEDQVLDMFPDRNVNALTQEFNSSIERVQEVLDIPWDTTACTMVNKSFVPTQEDPCTLFKMPYEYTGQVWSLFRGPLSYAQFFVESWMLEYTSGVKNWAYGKLTVEELEELFNMHIESMKYSTNLYNSRAFGSEHLIYILASLNSAVKGEKVGGIEHDPLHRLVMFFSHDTNIYYLRNLLGVEWRLPSNDATTASMLRFELMRDKVGGKFFVRTSYIGSSPTNQRNAKSFIADSPTVSYLVIPICGEEMCPLETFQLAVMSSVDPKCMLGKIKDYALRLMEPKPPSSKKYLASSVTSTMYYSVGR